MDYELNQIGVVEEQKENGLKLQKLIKNIIEGQEVLRNGNSEYK